MKKLLIVTMAALLATTLVSATYADVQTFVNPTKVVVYDGVPVVHRAHVVRKGPAKPVVSNDSLARLIGGVNDRLDKLEAGQAEIKKDVGTVKTGLDAFYREARQAKATFMGELKKELGPWLWAIIILLILALLASLAAWYAASRRTGRNDDPHGAPEPVPAPAPTPAPNAEPAPTPAPEPTPVVPTPLTEPTPISEPTPEPAPVPVTKDEPRQPEDGVVTVVLPKNFDGKYDITVRVTNIKPVPAKKAPAKKVAKKKR